MLRWYAITTHPGQEFRAKAELERRTASLGAAVAVGEVVVPTEQRTEDRSGQKLRVESRIMPGYVLINAQLTDAVWALIRGTQGVAGLVGAGNRPVALSRAEVDHLLNRSAPRPVRSPFTEGQSVEIVSGPLVGLAGRISAINEDAARLKVTVSMFGRETEAAVSFDQVKAQ